MRTAYRRALVTGGAGFIGSHLVEVLTRSGCAVTVYDNMSTGSAANLAHVKGIDLVEGDVLNYPRLARAAAGCDIVYHLAGIVGMRLAHSAAGLSYDIANRGTRNLLDATGSIPCVLFSSSCVYGLRDSRICREDDEALPDAALAYDGGTPGYACGKLALEAHGKAAAAAGRDVVILRPFNVVGTRQSGEYGMVLPRFIDQALSGVPITIYGDGRQSRCFSDVDVFTRAVVALAGRGRQRTGEALVLNIGTTSPTTVNELARFVARAAGVPLSMRHVPFTDVFPGRRDVLYRVPCTDRFDAVSGRVEWPGIDCIVRRSVAFRRAADRHRASAAPLSARPTSARAAWGANAQHAWTGAVAVHGSGVRA